MEIRCTYQLSVESSCLISGCSHPHSQLKREEKKRTLLSVPNNLKPWKRKKNNLVNYIMLKNLHTDDEVELTQTTDASTVVLSVVLQVSYNLSQPI